MDIDKKKYKEFLNIPKWELIETIMLYQEALQEMTAHRNELERELLWVYSKLDDLYKEVLT